MISNIQLYDVTTVTREARQRVFLTASALKEAAQDPACETLRHSLRFHGPLAFARRKQVGGPEWTLPKLTWDFYRGTGRRPNLMLGVGWRRTAHQIVVTSSRGQQMMTPYVAEFTFEEKDRTGPAVNAG